MEYRSKAAPETLPAGLLARVRLAHPTLPEALRTCADFLLRHPWETRGLSIHELAARAGVSAHAVNRFARRVGYSGYREFSQALATELGRIQGAAYAIPDSLAGDLPTNGDGDDAVDVVTRVLALEQAALQATLRSLDAETVRQAVRTLGRARRVLFVATGVGLSTCELAAYRFKVLGVPASCTGDAATVIPEIHLLEPGDVVVGVSYHGYTRSVIEALAYARERELATICITAAAGSPAARRVDLTLIVSGRDEALGLDQFASRISTAALLEALTTAVAWLHRDTAVPHANEVTLAAQRRNRVSDQPARRPKRRSSDDSREQS